eukprot:gene403-255_t
MAPTSLLATSRQLVLQSMERAAVASGLDAHTTVGMLSSHAHDLVGHPDNKYVMFRKEDATAWMVFTVSFAILIIFDNFVLNGERRAIGIGRAAVYTVFWMLCAGAFACWIHAEKGKHAAFDWTSGYLLEWMLSFDNLFVFHLIFQIYGTPDHLKHKPLFWGICGAVFFRLLFIFIGEYLMHAMWAAHLFFGAFLVYTGVHSAMVDEDDEDPTQNPVVIWLQKHVPFVAVYDAKGSFFVQVPVDADGHAILPGVSHASSPRALPSPETASTAACSDAEQGSSDEEAEHSARTNYGAVLDFSNLQDDREAPLGNQQFDRYETRATMLFLVATTSRCHSGSPLGNQQFDRYETRATMLFLVVCCLEISDILFAVDSVSAIVAQVSDLFLAYTSAVLRPTLQAPLGNQQFDRYETRATMLFLVVCCLEISDILFAVDSVSAIVAQVSDLFLAYTSAVFAMLGLRSTFFIIDVLVKLFSLLKYGVAAVLVFIGIKLIVSKMYHIPPLVVVCVLFGTLSFSMIASVWKDWYEKKHGPIWGEAEDEEESFRPGTTPEKPALAVEEEKAGARKKA